MDIIWDAYIAVNPDGDFMIFPNKPKKIDFPIVKIDYTQFEFDYHGHHDYKSVPTGEIRHFWGIPDNKDRSVYNGGHKVNPKSFNEEIQKMTWESEPIKL